MEDKDPYRKNAKPPETVCTDCKSLRWQRRQVYRKIVIGTVSAILLSSLMLAFFFGIGAAVDVYDGTADHRHYLFAWTGAICASLAFVGCIGMSLPIPWHKLK